MEYFIEFLKKHRKKFLLGTSILVLFLVVSFVVGGVSLPQEFIDAREEAARISADIVTLTNATSKNIKRVDETFLKQRNRAQTATLVDAARSANKEAYAKAFELSRKLQTMAESLASINSYKTKRLAYDAVAVELSLISEFISYTQALDTFLNTLSRATVSGNVTKEKTTLKDQLLTVNQKVELINRLNDEFLEKIQSFDSSL